jgi:DNA-directed RNA polymerase I and III subunit RPAC1
MDASRLVEVLPERIGSVSAPHFPHNLPSGSGSTSPFSLSSFASSLRLHCTRLSASRLEFDLVGVDASIANALRRVLMAEVPTVAVEGMYVWNNTSIVQDEVLAHRIGLVPLRIDPEEVQMKLREYLSWQKLRSGRWREGGGKGEGNKSKKGRHKVGR